MFNLVVEKPVPSAPPVAPPDGPKPPELPDALAGEGREGVNPLLAFPSVRKAMELIIALVIKPAEPVAPITPGEVPGIPEPAPDIPKPDMAGIIQETNAPHGTPGVAQEKYSTIYYSMDQNSALQQSVQTMVGESAVQDIAQTPTVSAMPDDKKQEVLDKTTETLMNRVLSRIAHILTEEDMKTLEQLDKEDTTGNTVKYFLLTRVPKIEELVKEEVDRLKEELQKPEQFDIMT